MDAPDAVSPGRARPAIDPLVDGDLGRLVHGIAEDVRAAGGRALVVGGSVRDALLAARDGSSSSGGDVDVEVYGLTPEAVHELVSRRGVIDTTGRSFAVYKVRGFDLDVSLPRAETTAWTGLRGSLGTADPFVPPERAALRRDFTINAIAWDPLNGTLVDAVGGAADLDRSVLRHVGATFAEDPLRVLRGAQFIARFGLTAAAETVAVCRELLPRAENLPRERVAGEWAKLLLRGVRPGRGLWFLADCGWIDRTPQLADLQGVPQDPRWHPEGDVFVHTAHVLDAWAGMRPTDPDDALITGLASLCHDLGKPATTQFVERRWRAHGHEAAGTGPTRALLDSITVRGDLARAVVPLVENHLAPSAFHAAGAGRSAVRRLAHRVGGRLDRLVLVAHADQAGRPPLVLDRFEAGEWLLAMAESSGIARSAVQPLLQGRDLIGIGLRPGPVFGEILAEVYEAQLDEAVTTSAQGVELAARIATRRGLLPAAAGVGPGGGEVGGEVGTNRGSRR